METGKEKSRGKNVSSQSVINEVNVKHSVNTNVQSVKHFQKPNKHGYHSLAGPLVLGVVTER